jgi:hypothetical protein
MKNNFAVSIIGFDGQSLIINRRLLVRSYDSTPALGLCNTKEIMWNADDADRGDLKFKNPDSYRGF